MTQEIEVLLPENNEDIHNWRTAVSKRGYSGFFEGWPSNLWSRPYDKIIEFLLEIRASTIDSMEYYYTLPYLSNDVEDSDLDQTFDNFTRERSNHTRSGAIACLEPVRGCLQALESIKNELNIEI